MAKTEVKKFVVRIRPDSHGRLVALAEENQRSLNNQVAVIFDAWFDVDLLRKRISELERN